eukprot:scaffold1815_cov17-Tisochrysis_lutea.AAC.5
MVVDDPSTDGNDWNCAFHRILSHINSLGVWKGDLSIEVRVMPWYVGHGHWSGQALESVGNSKPQPWPFQRTHAGSMQWIMSILGFSCTPLMNHTLV